MMRLLGVIAILSCDACDFGAKYMTHCRYITIDSLTCRLALTTASLKLQSKNAGIFLWSKYGASQEWMNRRLESRGGGRWIGKIESPEKS